MSIERRSNRSGSLGRRVSVVNGVLASESVFGIRSYVVPSPSRAGWGVGPPSDQVPAQREQRLPVRSLLQSLADLVEHGVFLADNLTARLVIRPPGLVPSRLQLTQLALPPDLLG